MGGPPILHHELEQQAAEYWVASMLSACHCRVGHAPGGEQVGSDLLCEMTAKVPGGDPVFLHFRVYVVLAEGLQRPDGRSRESYSFPVQNLEYWAHQPTPVFAFLVPETEAPWEPSAIYIVNVTKHLITRGLPEGRMSAALPIDYSVNARFPAELRAFLRHVVPLSVSYLESRRSLGKLIPALGESYGREFVAENKGARWLGVCEQIRRMAAMSLPSLIDALPHCPTNEGKEFLRVLRNMVAPIVHLFAQVGDQHWETHYALGVDAMADGNTRQAVACFEKAEGYITIDEKFRREYPDLPLVIEDIKRRLQSCQAALSAES